MEYFLPQHSEFQEPREMTTTPNTHNVLGIKHIVLDFSSMAAFVADSVQAMEFLQSDINQLLDSAVNMVAEGDFIETTLSLKIFQAELLEQAVSAGAGLALNEAQHYALLTECVVESLQKLLDSAGIDEKNWPGLKYNTLKRGLLYLTHTPDHEYE